MKTYLLMLVIACSSCSGLMSNKKTPTIITQADMRKIDVGKGEAVYQAEGKNHNMKSMSFVITETKKGGGPPLHIHPTEEAHSAKRYSYVFC